MAIKFGGGVSLGTPNTPFLSALQPLTIAPAQCWMLPPGPVTLVPGQGYAGLEVYDSGSQVWRPAEYPPKSQFTVDSDGTNYRIINRTGCPVGAIITDNGSSYTSAPTVAVSAGGSAWTAIVGGSINTTVTVTTAGSYSYIPTLTFSAPPAGGVRASGYAVLSNSTISSVTVTNAGAGYTSAPTITITQDPRDTGTGGGVLTVNSTLTNSQRVTAVICTDPGTAAQTSTPTLTFSGGAGGGAAATVLMNYTVTGFTVTNKGSSLGTSSDFLVTSGQWQTTTTSSGSVVDPQFDVNVASFRQAWLRGYTNSTGNAIASNTSLTTIDAGWGFQRAPSLYVIPNFDTAVVGGFVATTLAATVGGTNDTWFIQLTGP